MPQKVNWNLTLLPFANLLQPNLIACCNIDSVRNAVASMHIIYSPTICVLWIPVLI